MHDTRRRPIKVTGADRVEFLHSILTNDIKILKPGDICLAALLSPTAKVLALVNVLMLEDSVLLATEPGFEKKTIELLQKFIITEDVRLAEIDASEVSPFSSTEEAEISRIEKGRLRYGVDVTEEVTLPETGLDGIAASQTKGCYPGQEVVARTQTYGGLQRKMVRLVFETDIAPRLKDKILSDGKEIGWITSACVLPFSRNGIAFGYVKKGFFEKSADVEIQTSAGIIKAVTALPQRFNE